MCDLSLQWTWKNGLKIQNRYVETVNGIILNVACTHNKDAVHADEGLRYLWQL